jgi:hypothetical protein
LLAAQKMMSEPTSDEGLSDAIRDLIKRGELDEGAPAYGVALQAIHGGYGSLTRMQRVNDVESAHAIHRFTRLGWMEIHEPVVLGPAGQVIGTSFAVKRDPERVVAGYLPRSERSPGVIPHEKNDAVKIAVVAAQFSSRPPLR